MIKPIIVTRRNPNALQNEFNKILADFSQSPYHTNKIFTGVDLQIARSKSSNVLQEVGSKDKIDAWFEAKTKGLMPKVT